MSNLPPLPALRAFEAAVRLGGFARAAAALNVSTSAISHQIRALESQLGSRVLERSTGIGGIRVTPAGARLLPAVRDALGLLELACQEIRGIPRRLTVAANVSVSTMWLAARLAEFSARHPHVPLNAIIQMDEPDFAGEAIDLAVVHVPEARLRPDDVVLMHERVFPVCSPELHRFASVAVCKCRLLQEAQNGSPEIDWRSWAGVFGLPDDFETKIVRYDSFGQVVGAALGGAGLALGRSPLIDTELATGRLVPLRPDLSRPASWRFVLRAGPVRPHPMLDELIAFLRAQAPPLPESRSAAMQPLGALSRGDAGPDAKRSVRA